MNRSKTGRQVTILSLPGLIRLISELDDHGPVSRGALGSTFDDLSRHQLRHAIDTARELGVIETDERTPARYQLTEHGESLAAVYDCAARWARARQYPSASSDFITRVQRTLQLLAHVPDICADQGEDGTRERLVVELLVPDMAAIHAPEGPQAAVAEWIETAPPVVRSVPVTDEAECTA